MSIRVTTLANGLRVATDHMPGVESVSVGVWADVGARHESPAQNGISHLLEHMAFKGTARRSARAIAEEIEAVGGHLNAGTGREHTSYFARVLKEDLPLAVDILTDILMHSTFDDGELVREREVVVQEIGQAMDTPDDIIFDQLQETIYPGQALGRSILGTVDGVRRLGRGDLIEYMGGNYRGARMVAVAAGRVDHQTFVDLVAAGFDGLAAGGETLYDPARFQSGEVREARDLEQLHVTVGFPGVAYDDDDFFALQVMATVLGGGMSSRLFQEVREVRGLAYSIFAFPTAYVDGGVLTVYAGTGEAEAAELMPVIAEQFHDLAATAAEDETARARAQLKANLLMSLESSSARCDQLGRQLLIFGRPLPLQELVAKVDAVDAAAVRRVAGRILGTAAPALAALGPVAGLEPYDRFAARFG